MTRRASLVGSIADYITAKGSSDLNELASHFSTHTREKVRFAIGNAVKSGAIHCVMDADRPCQPARLYPGPAPQRAAKIRRIDVRPPASVWELAHGLQIAGTWPPQSAGQKYQPLGDWNAE